MVKVVACGGTDVLYHLIVQSTLIDRIKNAQKEDLELRKIFEKVKSGHSELRVVDDGV